MGHAARGPPLGAVRGQSQAPLGVRVIVNEASIMTLTPSGSYESGSSLMTLTPSEVLRYWPGAMPVMRLKAWLKALSVP